MTEIIKASGANSKRPGAELKRILNEIRLGEKEQEIYLKRADKCVKRYRDEDRTEDADANLPPRFNILWSNVETTTPLYFSRVPRVQVDRRFKDADPLGRLACQIWERGTQFSIDNYDFAGVMQAVVKDYQLAGRGTAWARYNPAVTDQDITYQEALSDHVHYRDFGHAPAKQWRNVRAVWRRVYLNKKQLKARFGGKDVLGADWKDIPLDYAPTDVNEGEGRKRPDQKEYQQACIYEYWDTDTMHVFWVSKNFSSGVLDMVEDPLGLHDFFPTPKPLFGVTTTEKLIPIPDYCLYQDQAKELDRLTMKIGLLQDSLRMVGWHDQTYDKELRNLYQKTDNNQMIPIANWQKLQAAGGIKGVAEWMPLGEAIAALTALQADRMVVKQDIYEITGIGDIIRGANSGQEITATETKVRGRFASIRVEDRKKEVERYGRDLIALHGEIIAEHFEPQILAAMTGFQLNDPQAAEQFFAACDLLRNDPMRSFRLTLETDSMAAVDEALDKQKTVEFAQTIGGLVKSALEVMQGAPVLAPMLGETILFTARRFNAGRGLEDVIETGIQGLVQMAQQSMSQPKPNPEMAKVEAQMQLEQAKLQSHMQIEQQRSQNDFALKKAELEQKAQLSQVETQQRAALENEKTAQQVALQREKMIGEMNLAAAKAQQDIELKHAEIKMREQTETKKAVLAAKLPDTTVLSDGSVTTRPIIRKRATFDWDPVTGKRVADIIEMPVAEVETSPVEASQAGAQVA